ncbi:MAG: RNA degradosome polyphosphate kinase [Pseudomonadota bacterium]
MANKRSAAIRTEPGRFFNRELSWLKFNLRVLEEASNPAHPLLERLRFLSISASNLDEFQMIRYAGLREQVRAGITKESIDGRSPTEQVLEIEAAMAELGELQEACWRTLKKAMASENIHILKAKELKKADIAWLEAEFERRLFPILTPLAVDPAHPFPFIQNQGFTLALRLKPTDSGDHMTGLVPIPNFLPRFVRLPEKQGSDIRFIALERVIPLFIEKLFPGFSEADRCLFRIVRDSDIEIEDEAEDLIREFEILLKQRRRGRIVRIVMNDDAPLGLRNQILSELEAEPADIRLATSMIGMNQLSELIVKDRPDLQFEAYEPRYPERIREHGGDCFAAIRQKDIVVHHPYESFDVVVQFLLQAAADPDVVAIKQTLYRTQPNSKVVAALIEAAEAGKSVTALVEIKARFDEETNLRLARDLERAGVQVVYGFIDYKTHAKVSLVVRREGGELRTYTHFGTGNYHPITARIYTDLALFTADQALGRDAGRLFNFITGYRDMPAVGPQFEKIHISPITLESNLVSLIEAEAKNAKAGKPSGIWAKLNSLADPDIIDALYAASRAGVPIDLVVRGICCLRAGVEGLSETITVKSIVGRFLEHSRIVAFANGDALPSPEAKIFISSADWMPRNLKRRVEALVPVQNPTVHRQVLNQILVANLKDNQQSWLLQPDDSWQRIVAAEEEPFTCHTYFMDNPSLSGRGSALDVSNPPRLKARRNRKNG